MVKIPTLREIYNSIITDIEAELSIVIPFWTKAYIKVQAMVLATKIHIAYLALGFVQKNIFPDTADPESMGGTLERFGRIKIGRMPLPATQGRYSVEMTGVIGSVIPTGAILMSDDTSTNPGMLFITSLSYTFTSSTRVVDVRALTAGTASRMMIDETMSLTSPIIGVDTTGIVAAELTIPNDAEDIEEYRRVVLESFRLMPAGGASADYRLWAQDASGVKQSYPYASPSAPNEVDVYIESSISDSVDGMGTPTATTLTNASSVIEYDPITGEGRRPLGVFAVNVLPVIVNKVTIDIPSFIDLTPEKQLLINNALKSLIDSVRPFIGGADVIDEKNDVLSTHRVIATIIETIPGAAFMSPIVKIQIGSGPVTIEDFKTFTFGNIPYLESVNYV